MVAEVSPRTTRVHDLVGAAGERIRRTSRAEIVLAGLVAAFVAWFGRLAYFHQRYFGNFAFDLGIYDQGIWLLSQGERPFVTVRGLHLFGHHTNFILYLWAPFYRFFGAGAEFLVVSKVVIVGLAAIPVYLLARDRLRSVEDDRAGLLAVGLAAVFLLNPSVQNQMWWTFHPDSISILPVLCTWLFATRRRWKLAALWAVLALLCKEDVALTLLAMGLVLAWRERKWRLVVPGALAGLWFVLMTRVVMTSANAGLDPFYVNEFRHLGTNLREIVVNSVRHPSRWAGRLFTARAGDGRYWFQITAPFGVFLPLLAVPELLLVVPQLFINTVTLWHYAADARYHYSALPVAALMICTVEVVGRLTTRTSRHAVVAALLGAVLITNFWWAPSPLGQLDRYLPGAQSLNRGDPETGVWRRRPHVHQAEIEEAIALIPSAASVSASFYIVPKVTHRREIYEFPTPFMRAYYRVPGEAPPDPTTLEYVLVDSKAFYNQATHENIFLSLLQPGSGFQMLYFKEDIVLLRRTDEPLSGLVRSFARIGL